MKTLLTLLICAITISYSNAQTNEELRIENESLKDSVQIQAAKISLVLDELNTSKKMYYRNIGKLKVENKTLRKIMKGYLIQIDSLSTDKQNIENEYKALKQEVISQQKEIEIEKEKNLKLQNEIESLKTQLRKKEEDE